MLVSYGFGYVLTPGHGAQADQADLKVRVAKFAVFQLCAPTKWFLPRPAGMPTMKPMLSPLSDTGRTVAIARITSESIARIHDSAWAYMVFYLLHQAYM